MPNVYKLIITVSSNCETEEEMMERWEAFEKAINKEHWAKVAKKADTCIIHLGVEKQNELDASVNWDISQEILKRKAEEGFCGTQEKMKINYVEGDLFAAVAADEGGAIVVPHVVNSKNAWGSGFVVPLGRRYPMAQKAYHVWHEGVEYETPEIVKSTGKFYLGQTQFIQVSAPDLFVANMVAQTLGGSRPLYYNYLAKCMDAVAEFAIDEKARIVCPMFGSGLAGGDWLFIEKLIEDCWLAKLIEVTVHYLPNTIPAGWTPPAREEK